MTNHELLTNIKAMIETEIVSKQNDPNKIFSDDVITLAYQKLSAGMTDLIQNESDPLLVNDLLQQFLTTSKMIDERNSSSKQFLLKAFEQLSKYEKSL